MKITLCEGDELITLKECVGIGESTYLLPKGLKVILKRIDSVVVSIMESVKNDDGTCSSVESEFVIDAMSLAKCTT